MDKAFYKVIAVVWLAFAAFGCTKGDSDLDYGNAYVYIPQATVSGGLNNVMEVPYGWGEDTFNFKVEDDALKVYLSVVRSGKLEVRKGFSVDVVSSPEAARKAVENGDVKNARLLSDTEYSLPGKASVEEGRDFGVFWLSVPKSVLKDSANAGKNLVVAVSIDKPTAYELSDANTTVVVAINVDKIMSYIN